MSISARELDRRALAAILRHHKERRSKCSVEPLVGDPRISFVRYHPGLQVRVDGWTLLELGAPVLSSADRGPLLLLDSTWRYLPTLRGALVGEPARRSLPQSLRTAYPRQSKLSADPAGGLASIEALYAALRITGRRDDTFLDGYRWRREFLERCTDAGLP